MIKKLYRKLINYDVEEKILLSYLNKYSDKGSVLDVGCGYGRMLKYLRANNINASGVEINPEIVASCRRDGLSCISVEEFGDLSLQQWDCILMFHIIEHMEPDKCFEFIDQYLDFLKPGGVLVVATPLLTDYFFEDFDHIKPYLPLGIQMVFGESSAQVQFRSRNKIELLDLRYKKYFYRFIHQRFVYLPRFKLLMPFIYALSALIFKFSFGVLGKKDGWIGVFRKI